MLIENDRRRRIERRVDFFGPPEIAGERRHALQRRVLDIGVLSFDTWLGKRPVDAASACRVELRPPVAGNDWLVTSLF